MKLSVGLITFNEEKILQTTLEAIKDIADEIIIVDSHSTDNTVEIAKSCGAKVYIEDWKGYGTQKNSVIAKCSGEWILIIDADEVLSDELAKEIRAAIENESAYNVYELKFMTVCFGKLIKYGGWSNFYRIRLLKNGTGLYDAAPVHEQFITKEKIGRLQNYIKHYTYADINDYMEKLNRYTSEGALKRSKKGKKSGIVDMIIRPYIKFLKIYIFKLGFLDGYYGYLLAKLSYFYSMLIYAKLKEYND